MDKVSGLFLLMDQRWERVGVPPRGRHQRGLVFKRRERGKAHLKSLREQQASESKCFKNSGDLLERPGLTR